MHTGGDNPQEVTTPGLCEGYLLKRRKWPLKGWHKRYFVLEVGILRYSKNQQDVSRGRVQGSLDVSRAVMSINKKSNRIDLDAGDILYHMKAKSHELFYIWVTKLQAHRLFKRNEAAHPHSSLLQTLSHSTVAEHAQRNGELVTITRTTSKLNRCHLDLSEINRLIQRLQALEAGQAFTNGDLQRIISIQVACSMTSSVVVPLRCPMNQGSVMEAPPTLSQKRGTVGTNRKFLVPVFSLKENSSGLFATVFSVLISNMIKIKSCFITASTTRKYRASISRTPNSVVPKSTGRRTTLPAHCPDNSHVGLMAILYNNIGKDLARVSMPAPLNEPVNLLQRLCEELEYSELLDIANNTSDPYQRMVYIAAFAISGYSTATFRNRYKPFNPVLGETYECISEDRGFRLISEQVCHHPPISACHADSENFSFWQDQRWKNKFWGKSVEILPTGMVNVTLPRYGDHYEWNKVVTCIHNVFSQQRYLEHYGEVTIRNLKSNICTCKITFVKSRYWGSDSNKNEVQGTVLDQSGSIIHRFGGLWHEGIFCDTLPTPKCVWKPNPQPKDYLLYYGFSTFAMELNELTADLKPLLPPTDTRLRPDQRMLEEGKVDEADTKKDEIEEIQRERRKELAKRGEEHIPRFFKKAKDSCGRDVWLTNGTYWKLRENPGFANTENLTLW
uniref:Oxysterol-binding protein n=1 Tax=Anabas testudineus TaxID=64144 RepID=A0A3Q1HSB9_ANATE